MGLFNRLLHQLIEVIEWVDTTQDTLIWKFPKDENDIKNGARLTVRESQVAVFMNEGRIADVFGPGLYELSTNNLPVLTMLGSWKYGFTSPFKADVYFVSTRQFINQRWGTQNPVMIRDAEFGALRLRAFGSYSFKVSDAKQFLTQISATNPNFNVEDVNTQLRNLIVSRTMDAVAASKIPALDLTASYDELGKFANDKIQSDFNDWGLTLTKLIIENISLPPEVEQMLDKRSEMGILGNLGAYAQFQAANSLEKAAQNSIGGNLGAAGMGLSVGAAMMNQMGNIFAPNQPFANNNVTSAGTPPPLAPPIPSVAYFVAVNGQSDGPHDMNQLSRMVAGNTLTRDTLVWTKGMANWAAASSITEIADIFNQIPPPLK